MPIHAKERKPITRRLLSFTWSHIILSMGGFWLTAGIFFLGFYTDFFPNLLVLLLGLPSLVALLLYPALGGYFDRRHTWAEPTLLESIGSVLIPAAVFWGYLILIGLLPGREHWGIWALLVGGALSPAFCLIEVLVLVLEVRGPLTGYGFKLLAAVVSGLLPPLLFFIGSRFHAWRTGDYEDDDL